MLLNPGETSPLTPGSMILAGSSTFVIERFYTAALAQIGNRPKMEDMYVITHDLGIDSALKSTLYTVIDGHGGEWCARFLQAELVRYVIQAFRDELRTPSQLKTALQMSVAKLVYKIFAKAYSMLDWEYYLRNQQIAKSIGGAVSVSVLVLGNMLFGINLGDCRAVISRAGKALNLSMDHKAISEKEVRRVKKDGGNIFYGRLGGQLAITRAFGDFDFKLKGEGKHARFEYFLSITPQVKWLEIDFATDEFVLVASDGVFDKMDSQQCVDFIRAELQKMPEGERDLQKICNIVTNRVIL
jgi:serine/threonine protein phosphatase PrpC